MARWIDKLRTAFSTSKQTQSSTPAAQSSGSTVQTRPTPANRRPIIMNRYDAVKMTGNRHRRLMDRGTEESEFLPYDREYAITLGRDMHRNQARYVSLENQISRMTAGTVKCQIGTKDRAWNAEAESVFNDRFAKDCLLQIPRTYLSDLCQQLVSSVIREGDVLVVYDDGFARDSGKLLTYEADQLVRMEDADFARLYPGCRQCSGVILDDVDAIYGYIVSHVRITDDMRVRPNGIWILPADKCLVYTTDQAVLLASRYRPGQIRGVPEMLPVSICMDDSDEMIKSELLTAKMGAKNWATVYESEATQTARTDSELAQAIEAMEKAGNVDPETGHLIDPDATPSAASVTAADRPHYPSIDDTDSAIVTYMEGRDRMDIHTPNRPNLHTDEFFRARNADAAASLGLARSHSEMYVQSSYTAFRGESLMTWESIYDRQKKLYRQLLDWLAVKVIERAIAEGELAPATAEARNWRDKITWSLPTMPHIDELRATEANAAALKAGLATYRDLLGSEWDEKIEQLAREVEIIRALGLPLAITETVSGAPSETRDNPNSASSDE